MAIFHLSAKIISRAQGRSATGAAAYRAGEKIADPRTGLTFDYRRRKHVAFKEILAPKGAPAWVKDRAALWQAVEAAELRKDAQLCREIEIALPHELSRVGQINLVKHYLRRCYVAKGVICDVCIHDNVTNVHAHVLMTMRDITAQGFQKKNRRWNDKEMLNWWRESWTRSVNRALDSAESKNRVDHRSIAAQAAKKQITQEEFMKTSNQQPLGDIGTPPDQEERKFKPVGIQLTQGAITASPSETMDQKVFDCAATLLHLKIRLAGAFPSQSVVLERSIDGHSYKASIGSSVRLVIRRDRVQPTRGSVEEAIAMAKVVKSLGWKNVAINGTENFRRAAYEALREEGYEPQDISGYQPETLPDPRLRLTPPTTPPRRPKMGGRK